MYFIVKQGPKSMMGEDRSWKKKLFSEFSPHKFSGGPPSNLLKEGRDAPPLLSSKYNMCCHIFEQVAEAAEIISASQQEENCNSLKD